ncbi:MAG: NAD(+)/NADH kinase [Desulfoplanes sp.]
MKFDIQRIIVVAKAANTQALDLAENIRVWFDARGVQGLVVDNRVDSDILDVGQRKPDCVIVLGGDGTMLSVARKINGSNIPMLGVNLGNVGFLTETGLDTWQDMFEDLLAGHVEMSSRAVLQFHVKREGTVIYQGKAVNDLVINRGSLARLVNLSVRFGGQHLGDIRADGVIVSTPTGSTAYSVSAGGPLVYPDLDLFVLTPICTFLQNFQPMVLPFTHPLFINVQKNNADVFLTLDGQRGIALQSDDQIEIIKSATSLQLIHSRHASYISKLKAKGFIQDCP